MFRLHRLALASGLVIAATPAARAQGPSSPSPRVARAVRVDGSAPRVDGVLDDGAWSRASVISDFVQKIPIEGAEPSVRTEVRIIYDNDALYVGAKMYRPDPRVIRTSITRRDTENDAETFTISLDTYRDRRTAYSFTISSGGVRGDSYHSQDSEDAGRETQFDPVWNASARVDADGWTAEMRIPFSQLRFNASSEQVWGMQLTRNIADIAERLQWTLIPISAAGFSSYFGRLDGIQGIPPSRRIELMPYVASEVANRASENRLNPLVDRFGMRAGADLKVGLGPNLTLDATINPDFGQVEADPAVVNLTAFEQVFEERRPFFIEGNELLTGRGQSFLGRPTWFYSRRIGASPRGQATGDFVDIPQNTTILGAAKITGRLSSGLSIGAVAALTPQEFARVHDIESNHTTRVAVEPSNAYAVARLQQEFGSQQSNVGLTITGVGRSFSGNSSLGQLLPSSAVAGGFDWKLRYKQGMYELTGWAGGSHVEGTPSAIDLLQRNSAHLFQRPDQSHLSYNPTRRSLSGTSASVRLDKNAGRFTLGGIQLSARSPGFDINDAGQMRSGDDIDFNADIQLRDTKPNRYVRFFNFGTAVQSGWNFGGTRQYLRFSESAQATLHNFLRVSASGVVIVGSESDDLTRGGPLMATADAYQLTASVGSRLNMPTTWSARLTFQDDAFGGWQTSAATTLTVSPASRWQASVDPTYSRQVDPRQYITTRTGGSEATFGNRYIFSFIERSTLSARFRVNYALTPNFTVEGYAEPFVSSGHFYTFGELPAPGSSTLRTYGEAGTGTTAVRGKNGVTTVTDGGNSFSIPRLDFNRFSFRSNLVLRWEWRPGSTAFLIWQQNKFAEDATGRLIQPGDLIDAVGRRGDNFLVAKVSYWFGVR